MPRPRPAAPLPTSVVLKCVLCRRPIEILASTPEQEQQRPHPQQQQQVCSAIYDCGLVSGQDFPLCSACWRYRHHNVQQASISEVSSLVETLSSVKEVHPAAIAAYKDFELEVDALSDQYVVGGAARGDTADAAADHAYGVEKQELADELAGLEAELAAKRGEVKQLQQDLAALEADEDALERRQNGIAHKEAAVASSAQSSATRLVAARAGFSRLGLNAMMGDLAAGESQAGGGAAAASRGASATTQHQQRQDGQASSSASGSALDASSAVSSLSSNMLGSVLSAAFAIDIDEIMPRINGRRVGRLPSVPVPDDEINIGCGFLALLMNHFLNTYTRMEKTGCSMDPQGAQSCISVFVPKRDTVDFHIKRRFFSWSTFGQGWVLFATCVNEVVQSMVAALRTKAQRLRSTSSFAPSSATEELVARLDAHTALAQSLPRVAAGGVRVDDDNVKYGDASDTQWTAAVRGLFRMLIWAIDADKFLAD